MKTDMINPELRNAFRFMPPIPFHSPAMLPIIRWGIRRLRARPKISDTVNITTQSFANIDLRIYTPLGWTKGPALLWVHGGGLISGQPEISDEDCLLYANKLNVIVVSVKYRLAPEYAFPAAIDDCFSAWQWISDPAVNQLGIDTRRIIIGGESAGGGLAASLCQRILDTSDIQPLAQFLCCPMLDDRTAANLKLDSVKHKVWNNKNNRFGWSAYLGQEPGSVSVPQYCVPSRREDLSGLPPAWIGVGDVDLFYEENRQYADRLIMAGVECELHITPGGPHGFHLFVPDSTSAAEFYRSGLTFLGKHFDLAAI